MFQTFLFTRNDIIDDIDDTDTKKYLVILEQCDVIVKILTTSVPPHVSIAFQQGWSAATDEIVLLWN